mmetsp:Transcript_46336/g.100759  ORF Transcript_46336/g.100759 Transcript_46336/m.100759 type:complete len:134 (-) Transcript_46336:547-948(-)
MRVTKGGGLAAVRVPGGLLIMSRREGLAARVLGPAAFSKSGLATIRAGADVVAKVADVADVADCTDRGETTAGAATGNAAAAPQSSRATRAPAVAGLAGATGPEMHPALVWNGGTAAARAICTTIAANIAGST